jgi:uncharacterized membrane protein
VIGTAAMAIIVGAILLVVAVGFVLSDRRQR